VTPTEAAKVLALLTAATRGEKLTVEQAEVWLALVMPTMQMSPNEPDAVPAGGGQYRANVIFTMSGTWNLEVHTVVRGQEYIAIFHTQTS